MPIVDLSTGTVHWRIPPKSARQAATEKLWQIGHRARHGSALHRHWLEFTATHVNDASLARCAERMLITLSPVRPVLFEGEVIAWPIEPARCPCDVEETPA